MGKRLVFIRRTWVRLSVVLCPHYCNFVANQLLFVVPQWTKMSINSGFMWTGWFNRKQAATLDKICTHMWFCIKKPKQNKPKNLGLTITGCISSLPIVTQIFLKHCALLIIHCSGTIYRVRCHLAYGYCNRHVEIKLHLHGWWKTKSFLDRLWKRNSIRQEIY